MEKQQNSMATPALLRRFWPYMARYKGILCFDLFCAALTSVCELVLPLIGGKLAQDRGGRDRSLLDGGHNPDNVVPISFDRGGLDRAAHEAFDAFVGRRRGDRAEFPVGDVAQTGHEPEAEKMAKGKDMVRRAAGISVMLMQR